MATKTIVDLDSTQTLSGKTLTAPTINSGIVGGNPTTALGIAPKQYVDAQVLAMFPIGAMFPYGGASAPSGWLLCTGANISRTTYAALFAIVGTTYGAGDGSTTFGLPDRTAEPDNWIIKT